MAVTTTIYLASPMFTEYERKEIQRYAELFRKNGHTVYVPMEHKIENGWDMPNAEWAKKVFEEDIKAIDNCETMVVLYYGLYSDSGTAWEQGYAYAKGKRVIVINCGCSEASLMVVNGQSVPPVQQFFDVNQT